MLNALEAVFEGTGVMDKRSLQGTIDAALVRNRINETPYTPEFGTTAEAAFRARVLERFAENRADSSPSVNKGISGNNRTSAKSSRGRR